MYKNVEKQKVITLKSLVDYMPGQVASKTLVQNDKVSVTVFSFDKGCLLYTSPSPRDTR